MKQILWKRILWMGWIAALLSLVMIVSVVAAADSADDPLAADNTTEVLSYSIILTYDSGMFTLKDLTLVQSNPTPVSEGNVYRAQVVSFLGNVLYETSFTVQLLILNAVEEGGSSGVASNETTSNYLLTKRDIDLLLPWYANAQKITILKNETLMLEIDVSSYAQCNENALCDGNETLKFCPGECTCGNGICDPEENYVQCQRDCKSGQKDGVCDKKFDNICDPECSSEEDVDCAQEESPDNVSLGNMPLDVSQESEGISDGTPKKTLWFHVFAAGVAIVLIAIAFLPLRKIKDFKKASDKK